MTELVAEDMTVPSEPGIDIYVRNKRPAGLTTFSPQRTLLFVHGSTYPAHTGFGLPLGGRSWMEYIASHGYDVYCLDVRGYGRSTRPRQIGEWDRDTPPTMAQAIFPLMVNSPGKRLVMLAEGTHHMMLEKNRLELFKAVQAFLDEGVS